MSDAENTDGLEQLLNQAAEAPAPPQATAPPAVPKTSDEVRKGNEVFQSDSPSKSMTREQYVKEELGFDIPIDAVPLPSAGLIYPEHHPLHHQHSVEYRAMTAREEDILMSQALIKKGTVISELIRSSLINKNIDVKSLLSGDQQAIMMAIRISGYGRAYEPTFECPKCSTSTKVQIDLAAFDIKPLSLTPVEPGRNLFEFILPRSKKTVHFKFLTVADEEKTVREAELKRKKGMRDNLITTQLLNSIVAVDGQQNQGYIAKFVANMPAMDSQAFRKYIMSNQPSVETTFDFLCSNCEHYEKASMPMTIEFFWPGSSNA